VLSVCASSSLGVWTYPWIVLGTLIVGLYGLLVNGPHWDFGRLLGVYVVFFFLAAQIIARLRFNQLVTLPVSVGGALIVSGGLISLRSGRASRLPTDCPD
jgi:hypothetical protein